MMDLRSDIALDVEGIFRLSGSAKRIKDLQVIFDSPDRYGKGLDWTGYTVHDAANILRRYLNQLPQPIVPLSFYERFRDPLRDHQAQAVGDIEAQAQDKGDFNYEAAIAAYQQLITELPPLNRQLLLYILDLLSVFASKSEMNRMNSANLSAIFQPGMLSHPDHDMIPKQYRLSQDVIMFLIENQDHFLVGMRGTAADEKTVKDIQSGAQRPPITPTRATQPGLGRSASNASAGADSLRKAGGLRRNLSVSSKNSRSSGNTPIASSPAPGSPLTTTASGGGVQRSNTVPSKKSPGIPSARFRNADAPAPTSGNLSSSGYGTTPRATSPGSKLAQSTVEAWSPTSTTLVAPPNEKSSGLNPVPEAKESTGRKGSSHKAPGSTEKLTLRTPDQGVTTTITGGSSATPTRERKTLFSKSPSSDTERKDMRQPNKLRKKRISGVSPNASAQSSTHSLHGAPVSPGTEVFHTPMLTPGLNNHPSNDPLASAAPTISNTEATPKSEQPPRLGEMDKLSAFHVSQPSSTPGASPLVNPTTSPPGSMRSRTSATATEESELEHTDDGTGAVQTVKKEKKHRWRLSSSAKPANLPNPSTPSGSRVGSNAVAEKSNTSILSDSKPRKSVTNDSHQTQTAGTEVSTSSTLLHSSNESTPPKEKEAHPREKDSGAEDKEKKGPIGWFKGKVAKVKEDRKEREAEKERAKSPPRSGSEHGTSKQSLGAIANQDALPIRDRSTDPIAEVTEAENGDTKKVMANETLPMQQ
ncbi:GTPase-activating protein SAC7, partial [Lecanoromycetidae sp. Uapishka_2]